MHLTEKVLAIIIVVMAVAFFAALRSQHCSGEIQIHSIPFIVSPQQAFKQGYSYGYIVSKIVSVENPEKELLKIRARITYVGNASAPEEFLLRPLMDSDFEVSLSPNIAKKILLRYQNDSKAFLDLLFHGIIYFDQDVPGRVWVDMSRLVNVTSEKPIIVRRNSTIVATILVRPANLTSIEREIVCSLLDARLSRVGLRGTVPIGFKLFDATTREPFKNIPMLIDIEPISISPARVYSLVCS